MDERAVTACTGQDQQVGGCPACLPEPTPALCQLATVSSTWGGRGREAFWLGPCRKRLPPSLCPNFLKAAGRSCVAGLPSWLFTTLETEPWQGVGKGAPPCCADLALPLLKSPASNLGGWGGREARSSQFPVQQKASHAVLCCSF